MKDDVRFKIGVKAVICNKGKILLIRTVKREKSVIKQNVAFWDFPGGRIGPDEDIRDALVREVREELRAKIDIVKFLDATVSNIRHLNDKNLYFFLIAFTCRLNEKTEFKLSDEHSEWKWVPINQAKKLLSVKYPKSFTEKLDGLS